MLASSPTIIEEPSANSTLILPGSVFATFVCLAGTVASVNVALAYAVFNVSSVTPAASFVPSFQVMSATGVSFHTTMSCGSIPPASLICSAIDLVYCALYVVFVTRVVSVGTFGVHGFFVSCVYSFFLPFTSFVPVVDNAFIAF